MQITTPRLVEAQSGSVRGRQSQETRTMKGRTKTKKHSREWKCILAKEDLCFKNDAALECEKHLNHKERNSTRSLTIGME